MLIIDYNSDRIVSVLSSVELKDINNLIIFIRLLLIIFQIIFFALNQIFDILNIEL